MPSVTRTANSLLLALCALVPAAQAQDPADAEQRWFQIEMITFSRQQTEAGGGEQWRRDIALAYPPNWVELRSEEQALAAENTDGDGDTKGDSDAKSDSEYDSVDYLAPSVDAADQTTPTDPAPEAETPYIYLPRDDQQLRPHANALRRDRRYRVLFHQAWRQPIVDRLEAPALLVDGGEQFGNYRELGGSVTFSVSRYLHLDTNLWLSQFIPNYGQQRQDWPELPTRPSQREHQGNALLFDTATAEAGLWSQVNTAEEEYQTILAEPYVLNEVVTLQQSRRMRSGEVHYIDHPQLGLIVKITRFDPHRKAESLDEAGE